MRLQGFTSGFVPGGLLPRVGVVSMHGPLGRRPFFISLVKREVLSLLGRRHQLTERARVGQGCSAFWVGGTNLPKEPDLGQWMLSLLGRRHQLTEGARFGAGMLSLLGRRHRLTERAQIWGRDAQPFG